MQHPYYKRERRGFQATRAKYIRLQKKTLKEGIIKNMVGGRGEKWKPR